MLLRLACASPSTFHVPAAYLDDVACLRDAGYVASTGQARVIRATDAGRAFVAGVDYLARLV